MIFIQLSYSLQYKLSFKYHSKNGILPLFPPLAQNPKKRVPPTKQEA